MIRGDGLRAADVRERLRTLGDLAARDAPPTAEEIDALLECLGDADKLVQRRAAEVCVALIRRSAAVAPRLRAALAVDDVRLRWGAAYALSLMDEFSPQSLDVLGEVLACADGDLRWAALELLKHFAARARDAGVRRLTELATGGTAQQRKMALYALRDLEVSASAAAAAAEEALRAPERDLRLAGIATLGRLATDRPRGAVCLLALLEDPDPPIRRAAAAALGGLGEASDEVRAALERARASTDPALRRAAERSLRLLENQPAPVTRTD